jgi:protocatechuate 3,4-dioxygenase beta subunit
MTAPGRPKGESGTRSAEESPVNAPGCTTRITDSAGAPPPDRARRLLLAGAATALLPLPALAATPACGQQTPPQTAGPFYTPATPRRMRLAEPGMAGTPLVLTGRVLTSACAPVAGALLDFWQCDAEGQYDNRGFRLRGHQLAGADGRYRLETIAPGAYPGRTPHIHVRVQQPGGRLLTTQLYLAGHPLNVRDFLYDPRLVMHAGADGLLFDFVLTV